MLEPRVRPGTGWVWLLAMAAGAGCAWGQGGGVRRPVERVGTGPGAEFRTVQAAVDAAGAEGSVIEIEPGVYREKISVMKAGIALVGRGARPEDTVLTWNDGARDVGGTKNSGSVTVVADDFSAENLTIENDFERTHERTTEGSQAVALMLSGDRAVVRRVRLLGFQDTLYANSRTCHSAAEAEAQEPCAASRQLFEDCYIEGHVDFIFGDARAVFDHCELHGVASAEVMLTAQSRLYPAEHSGYLFLDCRVTAAAGVGKLVLGRPWRAYSTVEFVRTQVVGARVDPAGWQEWSDRLKTSTYAEFETRDGQGRLVDVSQRVAPSRQLSPAEAARLTVGEWLGGSDGWSGGVSGGMHRGAEGNLKREAGAYARGELR